MMMRFLKLAVSVGVLAALLYWTDTASVMERLRGADLMWLSFALLALTVATLSMARRWQLTARALAIDIGYLRAVREYYIAQLVNYLLPGGVVGDIGRAVRVRREGDLVRAAQSVAAERILGQIAIFSVMGFGFFCALLIPGGLAWPPIVWAGIATLAAVALIALAISRRTDATARFLRLVLTLLRQPKLLGHAILTTTLLIFSLYACARATGTMIPAAGWATLIPLVLSSMLIPLSVGGWGWREGAAAACFPLIGAAPSAGIAMSIAYGAMLLIATLPAGVFLVSSPGSKYLSQTQKLDSP